MWSIPTPSYLHHFPINKNDIRSKLLKQRSQLGANECATLSTRIVQHIKKSSIYQQAKHVALYLPCKGEVDLTALLINTDKHHYIPSIKDQSMQFHQHTLDLPMESHRFGITQPAFIEEMPPAPLELCLMPLVGFDSQGHRLGMGGGFYDRYFEHNKDPNSVMLVGIAYQFQKQQKLPAESWDVRIDHLFTEHGYTKL